MNMKKNLLFKRIKIWHFILFHLSLTKKRLLNKLIENKFFLKTKIILLINLNIIKSIF